jgi:multidrug efflux pump
VNNNIATWAIKHRQVIYFFMALLFIMGIYSYNALGRSEDPSFTVKQMVISAAWPGATAKEMEMQVTDKIEKTIQTVPDVDYVTSYSRPGVCVITVTMKEAVPGSVIKTRWQEVRNLVSDGKTDLPSDLYGPYFNDHFDDVFGNIYAVTSDSYSYEDMRKVASNLKDQFVLIPDVKKVELVGVQPERIYIQVANAKLSQLGMSIETLASIIQSETAVVPSGMAHNDTTNTYLRLTGLPDSVKNIESLPLSANGRTFRLGDIAQIKRDYADPAEPKMYFDGKPAVGIAISMEDGGNNIRLGENLNKTIKNMQENLPLGFELHQVSNQPEVVKSSISEFMENLIEAIIIVLVVSLMSLGRKSGYVISVCIPLVLLCSFVGMFMMGIDLHKISLGSLIVSLGMLVDDSIVVVEMIELKINEGWERVKACSFAFQSCAKPLLTGTMITCSSFMPIAFSKSTAGEFAGSLFPVITVTLMSSWLIAATVSPVLSYAWITPERKNAAAKADGEKTDGTDADTTTNENTPAKASTNKETSDANYSLFNNPFYVYFRKLLNWSLHNRKIVVLGAIILFCGSIALGTLLRQEFFPASVRPELLVELNLPEGSSIAATDTAAEKLTNLIKDNKDVASVATYVGKSAPRFVLVMDPVQPRDNYAQLVIVAKDSDARERLVKKVDELVNANLPNVQSFSRNIPLGPPTPYPVMIRVSAPTDALAKEYAGKVRDVMMKNKNITMVRYDWMEKAHALKIEIDNDKLRQMGLTRKTVAVALQAEVTGYTVSHYYEGDQSINLVFRLEPRDHNSIQDIGTLPIPTANGAVQLNQVAKLSFENEDGMIWRRNLLPTVTVNAGISDNVTGNDVSNQVWAATSDLRKHLPLGVSLEVGGPAEKSAQTLTTLLAPVPAMLVIMLVLLMIQLRDIRKLIVVILTAPLGIVGVVAGLFIFNTPLSLMAEIGALALIGTIIRNSTVLVDQIDQHLAEGMPPAKAVTESVIVRFRPIMLTALTTVLGLIPMFPSAFWRGLAVSMACGLTGATMITLLILPVLYCIIFQIDEDTKTS